MSLCCLCHSKPAEVSCACIQPAQNYCPSCYSDHTNASDALHTAVSLDRSVLSPKLECRYRVLAQYSYALKDLETLVKTQIQRTEGLAGGLEQEAGRKAEETLVKELDIVCEVLARGLNTVYQAAIAALGPIVVPEVPASERKKLMETAERVIALEEERKQLRKALQTKAGQGEEEKTAVQLLEKECEELKEANAKLIMRLGRVENECGKLRGERDRAQERMRALNQKTQYLEQEHDQRERVEPSRDFATADTAQTVCPTCQIKTWPSNDPWRVKAMSSTPELASFMSDFCSETCFKQFRKELGYSSWVSSLLGS